jgi:hypothetical protein
MYMWHMRSAMAGVEEMPKVLDADALIDEIIARKGPHEFKGGLSEDNWEEVSLMHGGVVTHGGACRGGCVT